MELQLRRSEQGAVLIHVAIGLLALLGFIAFAADYGMLWVSRSQAQAAADAGALAGATALGFDGAADPSDRARNVAWNVAHWNKVWDDNPGVIVSSPYGAIAPCASEPDECIRVDTYRTGEGANHGTALPTWFANLFGTSSQKVRAMAVAYVGSANSTDCLKPFAIPDLFTNNNADPTFNPGIDTYNPLGYTLAGNIGQEVFLRQTTEDASQPGWFRLLDLIGSGGGGTPDTRAAIESCAADPYGVGDTLTAQNGVENGIKAGVTDLIDLDPDAYYDAATKQVRNSCADDRSCDRYVWDGSKTDGPVPDPTRNYSPRVMPLAIYDPNILATEGRIQIVNILGFFLENDTQWTGSDKYLKGIIVNQPGFFDRSKGNVADDAAFTKVVKLIR
jgi:hypothetical protein